MGAGLHHEKPAGLRHENSLKNPPWPKVEITMLTPDKLSSPLRGVGATSLGQRFLNQTWMPEPDKYSMPIHSVERLLLFDDRHVVVKLCDGHTLRLFTDEKLIRHVLSTPGPAGIAFLYNIADSVSWRELKKMIETAIDYAFYYPCGTSQRFMIVGCKCDLVQEREVDYVTVKQYADEKGLLFIETSAKEDINVEPAFVSFVAQLLDSCA